MSANLYKYHVISTNAEIVTSPFGWRVFGGKSEHHDGIDFVDANRRERMSDVYITAFADGKIVAAGYGNLVGNYVDMVHPTPSGSILTRYFHMKNDSIKVKTGQEIKKGVIIGIMGTTGNSTGIHLHFGLKENSTSYTTGVYVDPAPYLNGLHQLGSSAVTVSNQTSVSAEILKSGNKVKVVCQPDRTAPTYDGNKFKCYYDVYDVIQVSGDRIVIGIGNVVTAAVNRNILNKA